MCIRDRWCTVKKTLSPKRTKFITALNNLCVTKPYTKTCKTGKEYLFCLKTSPNFRYLFWILTPTTTARSYYIYYTTVTREPQYSVVYLYCCLVNGQISVNIWGYTYLHRAVAEPLLSQYERTTTKEVTEEFSYVTTLVV